MSEAAARSGGVERQAPAGEARASNPLALFTLENAKTAANRFPSSPHTLY